MDKTRFSASLALVFTTLAMARSAEPQTLRITLRVVNWANVPPDTLLRAEQDATYILGKTSVEIRWVDCSSTVTGAEKRNPCYYDGLGPAEFWLRILPQKAAGDSDEMLGLAVPDLEPAKGLCCANVSYPKVEDLARRWEVEAHYILGAAAAHEIGHLLLGAKSHSGTGIMCARWVRKHAKLASTGDLLFTSGQGEQIRAELARRQSEPPAELRAGSRIKFRTVEGYLVVVPVYVNSHGPYDFVLDTGTNTTLIDVALAGELGLKPIGSQQLSTLAGAQIVPRFLLETVAVGLHSLHQLDGLAQGMRGLQVLDSRIRGVIGLDFLLKFGFLLDYRHRQLELFDNSELPEHSTGTRVPIQVLQSRILIPARTEASPGGVLNLVLDSGISNVAIFANRIQPPSDSCRSPDGVEVKTNSSSVTASFTEVRDLEIATYHLRRLSAIVLPTDPGVQRGIEDGLLPTSLFQYLLVVASQGYVTFEFDESSVARNR